MLSCCNGTHFENATLTARKAGGTPLEFLKIKIAKVFVSAVAPGGSMADNRLTENVSLNFGSVEVDYTPQTDKGAAGTAITLTWDLAANVQE
jgi:type VI secretion system secreted protein Hcp